MNGTEFRKMLIDERVKFVELAHALGIAPQTIQSRLRAQSVSTDFIEQVEQFLGKKSGYFANKYGEGTRENKDFPIRLQNTFSDDKTQSNALILLCQKQSDQISDLLDQQRRLIAIIEKKNNIKE